MDAELHVAVKAFIVHEGKVLLIRMAKDYIPENAFEYDVPGGKVKAGEKFAEGLKREVNEETGLSVRIGEAFSISEWWPMDKGKQHHIVGTFIECFSDTEEVRLSSDHDKFVWIKPEDFQNYLLIGTVPDAFKDYIRFKKL